MNEEELKKKYFEYVMSLKGKEFLLPPSSLLEALDYIICTDCPLKNLKDEGDCGGPCIEKGWEEEFDKQYMVKIKIIDFIKSEEGG